MKALLLTPAPASSLHFTNSLSAECGEPILRAGQCPEALQKISQHRPGLVIVDEQLRDGSAHAFIKEVIAIDAFVNVAVLSSLPEESFHEAYEGLGVLAQLPPRPGRKEALDLLDKYRQVALPA